MWSKCETSIAQVFASWDNRGIFYYLNRYFGNRLLLFNDFNPKELDFEYFGNRSGTKVTSPLVDTLLRSYGLKELDKQARQRLASIIFNKYGLNWNKLYETLLAEYNPIENYNMREVESPELERKITGKQNSKIAQTTDNGTSRDLYGFNSTQAKPVDKGNAHIEVTTEGKEKDNYQESTEQQTGKRTLTRSGNIGVTTSQQMLESERKLWLWSLVDQVYGDVDEILTSNYYIKGENIIMPLPINNSGYIVLDLQSKDIATSKTISGLHSALAENEGYGKAVLLANVIVSGTEYPSMSVEVKKSGTSYILFNSLIQVTITNVDGVTGVIASKTPYANQQDLDTLKAKKIYYHPIVIENTSNEAYKYELSFIILNNSSDKLVGTNKPFSTWANIKAFMLSNGITTLNVCGAIVDVVGNTNFTCAYLYCPDENTFSMYGAYPDGSSLLFAGNLLTIADPTSTIDGVNEIYPNLG